MATLSRISLLSRDVPAQWRMPTRKISRRGIPTLSELNQRLGLASGWSHRAIAKLLQRSQSTASRKIARAIVAMVPTTPYVAHTATLSRMTQLK
ncbi:helix-turn-helix domain-containing protein [Corynebacterium diphtheriae]|uniref:helix-turn-helix domain-containing protein n=1 Tax=Corynebacterium diphtheriae TaxID=1717 RepID=UPI0011D2B0FC|nr:helix-turn-helix domain-containing protein [Corynebacterium diphtheriae]